MITGAALATINRLPVLLLPGDIFARRNVAPVLQQLESPSTQDIGVNDCFKPVSRYWDRIYRPEQIITALPEVMRVLTSPAETGAVTLALPQDVQAEAYDFPEALVPQASLAHPPPASGPDFIRSRASPPSARPQTTDRRRWWRAVSARLAKRSQSFAAKPASRSAKRRQAKAPSRTTIRSAVGRLAPPATSAANRLARDADLVIGIGTRYSDFTTASMTAFQNPEVRFVNINVAEFDAYKVSRHPRGRRCARRSGASWRKRFTTIASPASYADQITNLQGGMGTGSGSPVSS